MKKLAKFLVPVAVAAFALVSCNKENDIQISDPETVTIRVHASADELKSEDPQLKTYIDTYQGTPNTILWGTGEYMKLCITSGEGETAENLFVNSTDASADAFDGKPTALFKFSVTPQTADSYLYQGLYPASAAATSENKTPANYKVNLPATQNATASSYDPAAYIMVTKPETFNSVQTDWVASYRRATALNKITLKNVPSGISINRVKITAEGKRLAGGRHFNLTAGEGTDVYGSESSIEVKYATALTGTNVDVWFTSWDVEIAEGEKLTIIAYTTDSKSYTKEITARAGGIKFQEGYLNTLVANLSGITPEAVAEFTPGDYVILAKKTDGSAYYALKGEVSSTRIASVDYDGDLSNYSGDGSIVWTIAASGSSYTIKNGGNYVGWTSGNAADLVAEADYDATKCLMDITDNGDGTYKVTNANTADRYLAKNTGNSYFAFYSSTGQYGDIVFVPATALETVATPTFSPEAGAVDSGTEVTISTATQGAMIYYTTDGSEPTTSSTQGNSVTITSVTTLKAIAVKDGMADSKVATAKYTINGTIDYPTLETSNVTLTAGTNGSEAKVNGNNAIKVGTSSKGGDMSITVPAGTTKLHLHAAAWSGVTELSLNITPADKVNPTSISLSANSGITGNSPFTLAGKPEDFYFVINLSGIADETTITLTSSSAKRFVVWGVNVEPSPDTPSGGESTVESITSGTFEFADSKLTLSLDSGVTIEQSKVSGSTAVNNIYNTVSTLRLYKGHALTFTGKKFTRIKIVVIGSYFGNSLTVNEGTLTPTSTSDGTIVWEGESNNVVITNNATTSNTQLRTKSFEVTYD